MEETPTNTSNITEQAPVMQTPEVRWDGYAKQLDHTEELIGELENSSDPLKNEKIDQNTRYLKLIKGKLQALLDDIDLIEEANATMQSTSNEQALPVEEVMIDNIPEEAKASTGISGEQLVGPDVPHEATGSEQYKDSTGIVHYSWDEYREAEAGIRENRTR